MSRALVFKKNERKKKERKKKKEQKYKLFFYRNQGQTAAH
jgi:hypothetical protein